MTDRPDPLSYPEEIRECWAVHQVLRTLGFPADDIFVVSGRDARRPCAPPALFVELQAGDLEFSVTLAVYESAESVEETMTRWTEFVIHFNEGDFDQSVMEEIYQASNVMKNKAQFLVALANKGIKPLCGMN
jgi:hypothetical protein